LSIESVASSLSPDAEITLFIIDASSFGGGLFHGTNCGLDVSFGGQQYLHISMQFDGFSSSTDVSKQDTPTIKIVPNSWIRSFVDMFDQGRGAILQRIQTFARFLDTGSDPDSTQTFPIDYLRIERLSRGAGDYFEWELSNWTDLEGDNFPQRTMLSDSCDFTYRTWDPVHSDFIYYTCPWAGANALNGPGPYYDSNNNSTSDPSQDVCPRNFGGCNVRYGPTGINQTLPFRGFPGMGAVT
jgi:lambda family phage minor tail protein L